MQDSAGPFRDRVERHQVAAFLVGFTLAGAAFPRVAYWLRWPTRLRGRALVAYVAASALQRYAVMTWLRRWLRRYREVEERLHDELGREPTQDEVGRAMEAETLRRHLGREPTAQELDDLLGVA